MPSIGPHIPPHLLNNPPPPEDVHEDNSDEDDYLPALPPDLVASRETTSESAPKVTVGPSFPARPPLAANDDEDSDDDVGPMPLPKGRSSLSREDAVREFKEKEERRRKSAEEAAKPKKLERDSWMLLPPSPSSALSALGSLDPKKLSKPRQFRASASSAPASSSSEVNLWTETPQERQERLADEVMGRKRRAVDVGDRRDEEGEREREVKRRREEEIRRGVEEHTRKVRGSALLDAHQAAGSSNTKKKEGNEKPPVIWDHARDMSLGGQLMDDSKRNQIVKDAKSLGDRFGGGGFGK